MELMGTDSRDCVYHHFQTSSLHIFGNHATKQLVVSRQQEMASNLKFVRLLKLEAKCIISILQEEDQTTDGTSKLQDIISGFKTLDNHVIVYMASRQPPMKAQTLISRPLVWINSNNMVPYSKFINT